MLTPRQSALFSVLYGNKDQYLTQYQISQMLPAMYPFDGDKREFHDSKARYYITLDIRQINADPDAPAVIVSNAKGVKIANEAETRASMRREYAAIFRKLKRAYEKERKVSRDGQLVFAPNGDMTVYKIFDALAEGGKHGEEENEIGCREEDKRT